MSQFARYAKYYDDMYAQKPYQMEVDHLESFWQQYSKNPVKKILSLGCGTATYEIILAKRGYSVVGVDISVDMLAEGRKKVDQADAGNQISLHEGDIRDGKSYGEFDAVIMMFNIAGYMRTSDDMAKLVQTVNVNLKPGGTFIFDAWFDEAVITDPPTNRSRVVEKADKKITRVTKGSIDQEAKLVKIRFEVSEEEQGKVTESVEEDHPMRYWSTTDLETIFTAGGVPIVLTTSFANPSEHISRSEWDMYVVARK